MNRVLEQVFPFYKSHGKPRSYYCPPEGSKALSFVFRVHYKGKHPIKDGRVILFFAPNNDDEPRFMAFELDSLIPLFAKDISNIQPDAVVEFDSTEYSLPAALGFIPEDISAFKSELFVQAVVNQNVFDPDPNTCPGNLYSTSMQVHFEDVGTKTIINLIANQIVEAPQKTPSEWVEYLELKSELLSKYHNEDIYLYAAIVLPKNYHERDPSLKYPVVYYIEGFTGTENYIFKANSFLESAMGKDWRDGKWPVPMLRVTLGSRFRYGHTSFCDGEINGPWGSALVQEFIPFLESKYPTTNSSSGRFLHGHSSGGWSTMWLQLQNPDFFGGTWSTAPDPVDFSNFQIVNIYEAKNMYWDKNGYPIPSMREHGKVVCSIRDENLVERVYGRGNGGQWDCFFAVYGPRDPATGLPIPLFNKVTGHINQEVVKYWERYDIVRFLKKNQELLYTKLRGKLHVICGWEDNYYLNGACEKLQEVIGSSSCGNYVHLIPGDHTTIRSRAHYQQIHQEIANAYALRHKES